MNDMLKTALIAVISSAVISIGAVVVKEVYFTTKQQVVTVDLQKVIAEEIQANMKPGVDEKTRDERAKHFGTALESALTKAAANGEKIVMVAPAVVRGAEDITADIKASIEADLKAVAK